MSNTENNPPYSFPSHNPTRRVSRVTSTRPDQGTIGRFSMSRSLQDLLILGSPVPDPDPSRKETEPKRHRTEGKRCPQREDGSRKGEFKDRKKYRGPSRGES